MDPDAAAVVEAQLKGLAEEDNKAGETCPYAGFFVYDNLFWWVQIN